MRILFGILLVVLVIAMLRSRRTICRACGKKAVTTHHVHHPPEDHSPECIMHRRKCAACGMEEERTQWIGIPGSKPEEWKRVTSVPDVAA